MQKLLCRIVLSIFLSCRVLLAQPTDDSKTVSREALYRRAYNSMSYLLIDTLYDSSFVGRLTPEEAAMYKGILSISSSINTLTWLKRFKAEKLPTLQGKDVYAFVVPSNKEVLLPDAEVTARNDLIFSNSTSLFNLRDGKPERTAVTERRMGTPIYVNTRKINHPQQETTLGDAISLLVHELGRKLGHYEIEHAVDSLAAKLKRHIDSQISTSEIDGVRIHVLSTKYNFFTSWVQETLGMGLDQNPSSGKQNDFRLWHNEGLYVLAENDKGVFDLTESLLSHFQGSEIVSLSDLKKSYNPARSQLFNSDWFRISRGEKGKIDLAFNVTQFQVVIPFLTSQSPPASIFNVYRRFPISNYGAAITNKVWALDYSQGDFKLGTPRDGLVRIDDPSYKVELKKKEWQGDDLVFIYEIQGKMELAFQQLSGIKMKLSPDLVFEYRGGTFEVKSKRTSTPFNYEFRIPNVRRANAGEIKVLGLELSAEKANLAHETSNVRVSTYLPSIEKMKLEGPSQSSPIVLKALSIWNGRDWNPLSTEGPVPQARGSHLRFVFAANEKIRKMSLDLEYDRLTKYNVLDETSSGVRHEVAQVNNLTEGIRSIVTYDAADLKQTIQGHFLFVEVEIDKVNETEVRHFIRPDVPSEVESRLRKRDIPTEHLLSAGPIRVLRRVEILTDSLSKHEVSLKQKMGFEKQPVQPPRSEVVKKPSQTSRLRCQALFEKSKSN